MRKWLFILMLVCIAGVSAAVYLHPWQGVASASAYATPAESDPYVRFDMEAYDQITQNYWMKPGDYEQFGIPELPQLFALAMKQASGEDTTLSTSTRDATAAMLGKALATATSTAEKKQWALQVVALVINTLLPNGRNELLTSQAETQLRQTVSNINPTSDLYTEIGASASSSEQQIAQDYAATKTQIDAHPSSTTPQQLARAQYVYDVLSNPRSRGTYDATKEEPTVFPHIFGTTLYLDIDKISPSTLQEFAYALDDASTTPLSSLVLDLRGNIGGSLDLAPYIIGLFVGQNVDGFDLFHQGDFNVERTQLSKLPELARYREIAVLTDGMTQSTAEVLTAAMKRFHLATVVGATTRGWGTVENTYPLTTQIDASTTYALLLVNSLTLRDDNNPIESNGVDPDIAISDKNWRAQLPQYFRSQSLISAVEKTVTQAPLQ